MTPSIDDLVQGVRAHVVELAHRLATANELIAMQEQRIAALEKARTHAEIESAQARVSRDYYKARLLELMGAMKDQGIELQVEETAFHCCEAGEALGLRNQSCPRCHAMNNAVLAAEPA